MNNQVIHIIPEPNGGIKVFYLGKPKDAKFLGLITYRRQDEKSRFFQTSEMATRFVKDLLDGTMSDP